MRVLERGTIDDNGSAFAQVAMMGDGALLCTFSNAGGQFATGGTSQSRSDDGRTWSEAEVIFPATRSPRSTNFLKPTRSRATGTVFAYGARQSQPDGTVFDDRRYDAVLIRSDDDGRTWQEPTVVPFPTRALEISHGILALASGRLLAPAATTEPGRLGERVLVAISDDDGLSWPDHATALVDPDEQLGFLEQKLTLLDDGRILATSWAVSLDDCTDRPNHFSLSDDDGQTWSVPKSMGIDGQTLSAVHLGGERFLLAYNRRYGDQGVVVALATFGGEEWKVDQDLLAYDPASQRTGRVAQSLADEMLDFAFGFPTLTRLKDSTVLLTYWSVEGDRCGIRWAHIDASAA